MEVLAILANPQLTPTLTGKQGDSASDLAATPRCQRHRRLSDGEVAELLVSYVEGISVLDLAQRYGVHRLTVAEHLERNGIPRRACVRRLPTSRLPMLPSTTPPANRWPRWPSATASAHARSLGSSRRPTSLSARVLAGHLPPQARDHSRPRRKRSAESSFRRASAS